MPKYCRCDGGRTNHGTPIARLCCLQKAAPAAAVSRKPCGAVVPASGCLVIATSLAGVKTGGLQKPRTLLPATRPLRRCSSAEGECPLLRVSRPGSGEGSGWQFCLRCTMLCSSGGFVMKRYFPVGFYTREGGVCIALSCQIHSLLYTFSKHWLLLLRLCFRTSGTASVSGVRLPSPRFFHFRQFSHWGREQLPVPRHLPPAAVPPPRARAEASRQLRGEVDFSSEEEDASPGVALAAPSSLEPFVPVSVGAQAEGFRRQPSSEDSVVPFVHLRTICSRWMRTFS